MKEWFIRLYFSNVCKTQYNWSQSVSGKLEGIFATYNTYEDWYTYIERASTNKYRNVQEFNRKTGKGTSAVLQKRRYKLFWELWTDIQFSSQL